MARRSAKAARKKDAKRQRAAEKRAERARRATATENASPIAAGRRLLLLRDAVVKGETPAPRGLTNLGNTCFFNAVMQNLSRVTPFRDYFVGTPPCPGEGHMTTALRSFFIAMWDINTSSVFDPSNLFTEVGKNNPSFKGRAQQDSHELMRVVFDAVIEEEKKRLTNVAKGILPPTLDPDNSDESSESEIATPTIETSPPHQTDATPPFIGPLPAPEPNSTTDSEPSEPSEPSATEYPPGPADSDSGSVTSTTATHGASPEAPSDDMASDEEVPAEKLITIVERAVGGVLSSTIECKECGFKSSVAEPFLDLQLPLVPRDEPEPKPTVTDTVKDKASKAASCLKLRREYGPKQEHEQVTKATSEGTEKKSEGAPSEAPSVPLAPPPPPPPPPLPVPPKQPVSNTSAGNAHCDVMRQLRETVVLSEPEPVQENRLIVYTGETVTPSPVADTAAIFDDDDDDSEECGFLSALFDDDLDDPEETAMCSTTIANGTSTAGGATPASASQPSSAATQRKPTVTPPPRKTSSFISSLFGGLGGVSAAPHGYRSVVGSLEEFTKIEVLEGDNAYGCEECTRREKLRAALQSRRKLKTVSKKSYISSNSGMDNSTGQLDIDDSNPFRSQDAVSTVTDVQDCATLTSEKDIMSEVKVTQGDTEVLMSSPVTSSESSSGVSSEDDGELIIEEELENPVIKTEVVCELTREDEDEIIKQFNVKIPSVRTTAEKRLLIRDAPNVLAVQLKRFTQVGYRGGLRKISGHVAYPLNLDMTPFVEETADNSSTSENNRKPDVAKRKRHSFEASHKKAKYEYILTGVVVHGGSLTGGHYTAYVREGMESNSRGGWYFCNDSKISRASEKDVLNSEAYLLYYERVHT